MTSCGHRAILVITRSVEGTSTSVARERVELSCTLDAGHPGEHRDETRNATWSGGRSERPTILRHEDEDGTTTEKP